MLRRSNERYHTLPLIVYTFSVFMPCATQYCQAWCSDEGLTADPVSSTFSSSSLVRDVDISHLVDVQRQTTSSPQRQFQPLRVPVRQTAYSVSTSMSTLPMPDIVRESFVDDLPASASPAEHNSPLVILNHFISEYKDSVWAFFARSIL